MDGKAIYKIWEFSETRGSDAPHMPAHGPWVVNTTPPHQLSTPGHIGILSISKEVFVEKFVLDGNVFNHGSAVKGSSSACPKDIFRLIKLPVVHIFRPTIKMAKVAEEVDPCRINDLSSLGVPHGYTRRG